MQRHAMPDRSARSARWLTIRKRWRTYLEVLSHALPRARLQLFLIDHAVERLAPVHPRQQLAQLHSRLGVGALDLLASPPAPNHCRTVAPLRLLSDKRTAASPTASCGLALEPSTIVLRRHCGLQWPPPVPRPAALERAWLAHIATRVDTSNSPNSSSNFSLVDQLSSAFQRCFESRSSTGAVSRYLCGRYNLPARSADSAAAQRGAEHSCRKSLDRRTSRGRSRVSSSPGRLHLPFRKGLSA